MKTPRYYQEEALQAIDEYFQDGVSTNPIIVMATGTGKALVIAEYIKRALEYDPSVRAICAIDTKELVQQNYDEFMSQMPNGPAGIYSSGLRRRQKKSQVLFCGIQSVYDKANDIGEADILLIDECHGVGLDGLRWSTFLNDMAKMNPNMIIVGFTATPYRMDSGFLWTGTPRLFNGVAYEYGIKQGIADNYLSNIISRGMQTKFDITGVQKTKGDYVESQLQKAVNVKEVTDAAVDEIIECGKDRKAWLVFGAGVEHCKAIKENMVSKGINAEIVLGTTASKKRDDIIADFKAGKIKCLINNAVLTKGFDAPFIDLIAAMRPTASAVLWTQMVGRGLRIAEGKENCLLLDFAQNISNFGFIDEMQFKDKVKSEDDSLGVPPMKECEECNTICHAALKFCPACGEEFPIDDTAKHDTKSYDGAVLSTQYKPEEFEVTSVEWRLHNRKTPPSLRVDYYCGIHRFSEWICLEHSGFARTRAVQWWKSRVDGNRCSDMDEVKKFIDYGVPLKIEDALQFEHCMIKPAAIQIKIEGKYDRIVGYSDEELIEADSIRHDQSQQQLDDFDEIVW